MTAINLAVDCVAPRKGLPKALLAVEPQFRYLIQQQKKYGFLVFFNINICRTNIKDVKLLTETAPRTGSEPTITSSRRPSSSHDKEHYKHQDFTPRDHRIIRRGRRAP